MNRIEFDCDTYRIRHAGEPVVLLPKEFALLRYLYEHEGRVFTREQLLDAVWRLESPGDRTVDDHIYRIRKKLARWPDLLRIEAVRGQGYKLVLPRADEADSPLLRDPLFAADAARMMARYHGLGMGAAMRLLAANKDVLGLPGDPFYDAYARFVGGDFPWLLETDSLDVWQKTAYAVCVHAVVQFDRARTLRYADRLLARGERLSPGWRLDLQLQAVSLELALGRVDRARERLAPVRAAVRDLDSPSFAAVALLREAELAAQTGGAAEADARLQQCEALLERHPMQRERGALLVTRALGLYRRGDVQAARALLDEGIASLRRTRFVPHLLHGLNAALAYLRDEPRDAAYREKYELEWAQAATDYGLAPLPAKLERFLDRASL